MSEAYFTDDEEYYYEDSIRSTEESRPVYDPAKITPAYHMQQAERALKKLKAVIGDPGWKKVLNLKNGVAVYSKNSKNDDDKVPLFMSQHIIEDFAPHSVFAVIGMRKLWDPWYEEGNLVENLDETTSLTYMVMKALAGTKSRDLSLVEKIEHTSTGTIYFATASIETPKVPRVVDKIRAQLLLNGWIIEPISQDPPRTKVTYVLQSKVGGWVPSVIAKKYLTRRPLVIYSIDQYLQKNGIPTVGVSSNPTSSYPSRATSTSSIRHSKYNHSVELSRTDSHLKDKKEPKNNPLNLQNTPIQDITREIPVNSNDNKIDPSSSQNIIEEDSKTLPPLPIKTSSSRKPIPSMRVIKPEQNSTPVPSQSTPPQNSTPVPSQPNSPQNSTPVPSQPNPPQNSTPILSQSNPPQNPTTVPSQSNPAQVSPPEQSIKPIMPVQAQSAQFMSTQSSLSPKSPKLPIRHRFTDDINKAIVIFKENVESKDWSFYTESKGVKIYMKDVVGRSTPIIRGEYKLTGDSTAEDLSSVINNLSLRKLWDERYDDGELIENYNNDELLLKVSMKGTFPISGRDFASFTKTERDPETGVVMIVSTSVVDPAIPVFKKYVRGHINFAGWQIVPNFDSNGDMKSLNIIYIVDTDLKLDSIPSSILKSISTGTPMVIQKIDDILQKIGFSPYVLKSSTLILSENLDIKTHQFEMSLKAENDSVTEIRFSKKMYPSGFDMTIKPENTKVELLPNNSDIIRITWPSKVHIDKLQIKIVKYTSKGFKLTYNEKNKIPLAPKEESSTIPVTTPPKVENEIKAELVTIPPPQKAEIIDNVAQPEEPIKNVANDSTNSADATLVANILTTTDNEQSQALNRISRKSRRMSLAIVFAKDESNEKQGMDEKNNEFEEDIKMRMPIESNIFARRLSYRITNDIIVISEKLRFSSHEVGLMFAAMLLSYYVGKLSHYFA